VNPRAARGGVRGSGAAGTRREGGKVLEWGTLQPACARCGGRLPIPEAAAPGASIEATCPCGHTTTFRVPPAGQAPLRATRTAGPLPAPRGGSYEVDPWSLPPPEDGYENLAFEDGQAGAATRPAPPRVATAAAPEPPPSGKDAAPGLPKPRGEGGAPDLPEPGGEDDAAPIAGSSRRRVMLLAAAAAGAVVAAGVAVWIVRLGSSSTDSGAGEAVRVRVTQEPSWMDAPPLAPPDPSFTEPSRRAESSARPSGLPSPPPRPSAPAAPAPPAPPREPLRAPSKTVPPPAPAEAASADAPAGAPESTPSPEPEPAPGEAAAASAAIPIPPPPVLPEPQAAAADGVQPAVKARAPALLTRTCVEDALRVPRGLEGRLPAEVILRVKVGEDGRPTDVSFGGAVDPRLASALGAAARSCRFAPGSDAGGRPAALTATMRVRFEP